LRKIEARGVNTGDLLLNIQIDLSGLQNLANLEEIKRIGDAAAGQLAILTHAKVQEFAAQKLHSRLEMFRKGLSMKQEDGIWIIHLENELSWIEDGMPAHSMLPDLLDSPKAKIASDGSKYCIIPFANTAGKTGATQVTAAQQDLVGAIKQQMKQDKIPWAKIDKDDQGRPKLGLLQKINVRTPNKTHEGPGQGWGAVGGQRVGATGIPFLQGAQVFQNLNSKGKVERGVITFRVASSKHMGSGRWEHPGLEPAHALNDAYEWALNEVQVNIMPNIIKEIEALGK
jgi:hypothetical protein